MSAGRVGYRVIRILAVIVLLYAFLVSIKMMGASFKMFGKGFAEALITSTSNPFVGLFIGILATSLVQSSSTVTSLVVGFVGGGMLPIGCAIPIIMGANVGTSITCTVVSMAFVTRKEDFKRAFAGATVHDFFNLCAVTLLFPLELRFHMIEWISLRLTSVFRDAGGVHITSPLKAIVEPAVDGAEHLLTGTLGLHGTTSAVVLLVASIGILIGSLIYLVKTMRSLVLSRAETFVERYLFRNDLFALLIGIGLTVMVQSSSVTTSLVVPLVGAGILSLGRCYPFTLGANLGTTCTALLASMATLKVAGDGMEVNTAGLTAALAHLCFNLMGIAVFYPLRVVPITLATKLAEVTAASRKWAILFVIGVFFLLPLAIITLAR